MTRHKLRATFQTWTEEMAAQNGKPFTILAMRWCLPEDHGGDNPEEVFEGWAVDVFAAIKEA